MTKTEAISKVFITAYRSLPGQERISLLRSLLNDEFNHEGADVILALQRRREKPIPYQSVRRELKKSGRLLTPSSRLSKINHRYT